MGIRFLTIDRNTRNAVSRCYAGMDTGQSFWRRIPLQRNRGMQAVRKFLAVKN
ncbi:hypothetical protein ACYULU_08475 [Breznakiellaceae bacterium SP9]